MPGMQEDAAERLDRLIQPEIIGSEDVVKMPAKMLANVGKKGKIEREPHRNRTCNLLIKSDDLLLPQDTDINHLVSDIQQNTQELCLICYCLICNIGQFVGKMLAKCLWYFRDSFRS
ncbi:MAG: hypothetical protein KKD83_06950 [Chloroflexi bacterium]|nr:hypothetical protein [Chloroflexota bacterium]